MATESSPIIEASTKIKILFLAADPSDQVQLQLGKEVRTIDDVLQKSPNRQKFALETHWDVRSTDLQALLLRHQPTIVHFSGHGSTAGELIVENEQGESHPLSTEALQKLFRTLKDNISCVVLNACYSQSQAEAIADVIDVVIGMPIAIRDDAAIAFSAAFYQAISFGRDIQNAYELGCDQIDLENLADEDKPILIAKRMPPTRITLLPSAASAKPEQKDSAARSAKTKSEEIAYPNQPQKKPRGKEWVFLLAGITMVVAAIVVLVRIVPGMIGGVAMPTLAPMPTSTVAMFTPMPTASPELPPTPLKVGVAHFTKCDQLMPEIELTRTIQTAFIKQHVAADKYEFQALAEIDTQAVARAQPYDVVFWGECKGAGWIRYNAEWLSVGDGGTLRVAEPLSTQLNWTEPSPTLPAQIFAAMLVYHASDFSVIPVALLNQTTSEWEKIQEPSEQVTLHWHLGNALLAYPDHVEDKALDEFAHILDAPMLAPSVKALILNNQGWAYSVIGKTVSDSQARQSAYLSATTAFSQALQIAPNDAIVWVNLGEGYTRLGQYDAGLATCQHALMVAGNFAPALICMARNYFSMQSYDNAIAAANQALSIDSHNAFAYYLLGRSHCIQSYDLKATQNEFQQFIDHYPTLSRWEKSPQIKIDAQSFIDKIEQDKRC